MPVHESEIVAMCGPNLRLADLRWLVERCADLPDDAAVELTGCVEGMHPLDVQHEKIAVIARG